MPKYSVVAQPGGHVVAVHTSLGDLVAISDHASRDSAQSYADRLNLLHENHQARQAVAASIARREARKTHERRTARYFPDDSLHG